MITAEDIRLIHYFAEYKGDHTRYSRWDEIKDEFAQKFPEFTQAYADLQHAKRMFEMCVKDLENTASERGIPC